MSEASQRTAIVMNGTGGIWRVRTADGESLEVSMRGRLKKLDDEALKLTVGDMIATFKLGGTAVTQVAINAHVDLNVVKGSDGKLRFDVGTPTVHVDIDEGVEGSNQLSNAEFEAIVSFALTRIVSVGSGFADANTMMT